MVSEAVSKVTPVAGDVQGAQYEGRSPTLEEWLDVWLDEKPSVSTTTHGKYRGHIDNHLAPALGHRPVDGVRPVDVERLAHSLLSQGLSSATVRRILGTLRVAFDEAVERGVVARNPAIGIELPGAEASPLVWSSTDVTHFLRTIRDDLLESLWRLMLVHRVRRSEVLDLRWIGVDLQDGVIDMRAVAGVDPRLSLLEDLVNPLAGDRFVTLDPETRAVLREHRRQQAARRLRAGRDWLATDLVFTQPDGRPLSPWALARRFSELGQAAGLPALSLNDIRMRAGLPEPDLIPRRR
ncbi:MAG: site-specific integrase [Candidatus Nanopelagicales bacterium]